MSENDNIIDVTVANDPATPELSTWDKVVNWIGEHKTLCIVSVIGLPIVLVWIGAKAFSKTNTVEVEKLPDPTIMDRYDRIPKSSTENIEYKYVLKPEFREQK